METLTFDRKPEPISEPDFEREKALSCTFDDPDLDFLFEEPAKVS